MKRNRDGLASAHPVAPPKGSKVKKLGAPRWVFVLATSLIAFGLISNTSFAQEIPQLDIEDDEEQLLGGNGFAGGVLPRMNRQQMEEYMYGSLGGSKAAFQKLKRESIRRELDRIHSICNLTDEQWNKLNEAIDVDVQHIENRITSILSPYDGKMTPQLLQEMQQKVWQFASSVQSDKVDKKAVWYKVLMSQLTKEQTEKIKGDESRKLANLKRTNHLRNLLSLQRKLGLNSTQRVKIEEWAKELGDRELDFHSICEELQKAPIAKEILSEKQLSALKEPAPPVPMNRLLPAMQDVILPAMKDVIR
ncbi:MAG: hypothetical protein NTY15_09540 [Planctomycetota bacterium]|nr:hypothetical protein [Planctomycetota bacterium]